MSHVHAEEASARGDQEARIFQFLRLKKRCEFSGRETIARRVVEFQEIDERVDIECDAEDELMDQGRGGPLHDTQPTSGEPPTLIRSQSELSGQSALSAIESATRQTMEEGCLIDHTKFLCTAKLVQTVLFEDAWRRATIDGESTERQGHTSVILSRLASALADLIRAHEVFRSEYLKACEMGCNAFAQAETAARRALEDQCFADRAEFVAAAEGRNNASGGHDTAEVPPSSKPSGNEVSTHRGSRKGESGSLSPRCQYLIEEFNLREGAWRRDIAEQESAARNNVAARHFLEKSSAEVKARATAKRKFEADAKDQSALSAIESATRQTMEEGCLIDHTEFLCTAKLVQTVLFEDAWRRATIDGESTERQGLTKELWNQMAVALSSVLHERESERALSEREQRDETEAWEAAGRTALAESEAAHWQKAEDSLSCLRGKVEAEARAKIEGKTAEEDAEKHTVISSEVDSRQELEAGCLGDLVRCLIDELWDRQALRRRAVKAREAVARMEVEQKAARSEEAAHARIHLNFGNFLESRSSLRADECATRETLYRSHLVSVSMCELRAINTRFFRELRSVVAASRAQLYGHEACLARLAQERHADHPRPAVRPFTASIHGRTPPDNRPMSAPTVRAAVTNSYLLKALRDVTNSESEARQAFEDNESSEWATLELLRRNEAVGLKTYRVSVMEMRRQRDAAADAAARGALTTGAIDPSTALLRARPMSAQPYRCTPDPTMEQQSPPLRGGAPPPTTGVYSPLQKRRVQSAGPVRPSAAVRTIFTNGNGPNVAPSWNGWTWSASRIQGVALPSVYTEKHQTPPHTVSENTNVNRALRRTAWPAK